MDIGEFKKIVLESKSFSEVSRKIYNNNYYGNRETIKKRINEFNINISHFDYKPQKKENLKNFLMSEVLTTGSTYNRKSLKRRLINDGFLKNVCEKCGQDELWYNEKMSLILDHINGISDDNRIENLRILCPNCNATLPTHGGKNIKFKPKKTSKENKRYYQKKTKDEIINIDKKRSHNQRKVKRPPYEQLIDEINDFGYRGTGRKYGVCDNTIKKWVKFYEKYGQ